MTDLIHPAILLIPLHLRLSQPPKYWWIQLDLGGIVVISLKNYLLI